AGGSATSAAGGMPGTTGATGGGVVDAGGDAPDSGPPPGLLCPTTFSYTAPTSSKNVRVAGEWQGFDLGSAPMLTGPDMSGTYTTTVKLAPGLWAYKFVYDDSSQNTNWVLDPDQGRRKYVGGVENSAVKVPDCSRPSFK